LDLPGDARLYLTNPSRLPVPLMSRRVVEGIAPTA
jgi:hypothetical protein